MKESKHWKARWQRVKEVIDHQGFIIVVSACVAVIIATAVWTGRQEYTLAAPTPPVDQAQSAAQLMQESLRQVATASPAPTEAPESYTAPLARVASLQTFDDTRLTASGVTGVYRVHDAVDLAAEIGDPVTAMADGTVISVQEKGVNRVCVVIDHGTIQATYAGMSLSASLRPGDAVKQGETIGFAGDGPMDEGDLEPHLHLRVTRNGVPIDPTLLWP